MPLKGTQFDPTGGAPTSGQLVQGVPHATQGFGAYGTIPQLPDPTHTATAAILGNIGNLGNIYGLGNALTAQGANQAAQQYIMNLPGYQQNLGQAAQNTGAQLRGELPQDVINLLQQQGAERGVSMGSPGSPNANAAYLRALGLTSIGQQQQGEQNLLGLIGATPTGPQFNPMSMLISPGDEQSAAAMQAIYNAAPNPQLAAAEALRLAQLGLGQGVGLGGGGRVGAGAASGTPQTTPGGPPGGVVSAGGGVIGQQYPTGTSGGVVRPAQGPVSIDAQGNQVVQNPDGTVTITDRQGNVTTGPAGTTAGSDWAMFNDPNWMNNLAGGLGNFDWQSLFNEPGLGDTSGAGGLGLNPQLNAVDQWLNQFTGGGSQTPGFAPGQSSGSYFDFGAGGGFTPYQDPYGVGGNATDYSLPESVPSEWQDIYDEFFGP